MKKEKINLPNLITEKMEEKIKKLTEDIIKYFPRFFDDFNGWQYGDGVNAGKHFKKIYNQAKKINKTIKQPL